MKHKEEQAGSAILDEYYRCLTKVITHYLCAKSGNIYVSSRHIDSIKELNMSQLKRALDDTLLVLNNAPFWEHSIGADK